MQSTMSHVLHGPRKGQARTFVLIEWLNKTPNQDAQARVVEIIDIVREIDQFGAKDLPRVRLGRWSRLRPTRAQAENLARLTSLTERLRNIFNRYKFSPGLQQSTGGKSVVVWRPSIKAGRLDIIVSSLGDTVRVTEGDAVLRLLRLIEEGYFGRIRKCSFCPKWLFARFKHQQYCGQKCQITAYKTTPEWRTRRRKYIKELRNLKRSGKVR